MSTVQEHEYKVGDVMILVRGGDYPVTSVNVDRLTKTQIVVRDPRQSDDPKQVLRFEKRTNWAERREGLLLHDSVGGRGRRCDINLYDYTEEAMAKLLERREKTKQLADERRAAQEQQRQEVEERRASELAEVKELCGGQLALITKLSTVQPDGTRFYVLEIPVSSKYTERKKGWELIVVKCKDTEEWDWRKCHEMPEGSSEQAIKMACTTKIVEFAATYANGSTCSFASCSTQRAKNDEEAQWETVRDCYNSW